MLFVAGFLKSKLNGEPIWWGGIRQLFLGGALALAGYLIAGIFQQA
jgi:VIT1/CCC1 family predicted Fe2+/Mn2+ transporter